MNKPVRTCTPVAHAVTIYMRPGGLYHVHFGDVYADMLTWDEMIGEVVHLTHPSLHRPQYGKHVDVWMERRARYAARRREPELPLAAPQDGSGSDVAEDRRSVLRLLYEAHHREPCGPTLEAINAAIQHLQAASEGGPVC